MWVGIEYTIIYHIQSCNTYYISSNSFILFCDYHGHFVRHQTPHTNVTDPIYNKFESFPPGASTEFTVRLRFGIHILISICMITTHISIRRLRKTSFIVVEEIISTRHDTGDAVLGHRGNTIRILITTAIVIDCSFYTG